MPLNIERVFKENSKKREKNLRNIKNCMQKKDAEKTDAEQSVYQQMMEANNREKWRESAFYETKLSPLPMDNHGKKRNKLRGKLPENMIPTYYAR